MTEDEKTRKPVERLNTAAVGYVLEYQTGKGAVTRTKIIDIEPMSRNESELFVLKEAMSRLNAKCELEIYTECRYIASAFDQGWIAGWMRNGWKTAKGDEVANKELWQELARLALENRLNFHVGEPHPYRSWLANEVKRKGGS